MTTVSSGQIIVADHNNDVFVADAQAQVLNNFPTTTSATYVSIGTQCGTSFTAPANGKVMIDWFTELQTSVAGNVAACTIEVRTGSTVGSGTLVVTASDNLPLCRNDNAFPVCSAAWYPLSGLTPGSAYNVRLMFRSDGTRTLTASRRGVRVKTSAV